MINFKSLSYAYNCDAEFTHYVGFLKAIHPMKMKYKNLPLPSLLSLLHLCHRTNINNFFFNNLLRPLFLCPFLCNARFALSLVFMLQTRYMYREMMPLSSSEIR